jgi:hypothetical protein
MNLHRLLLPLIATWLLLEIPGSAIADNVRYVTQNGVTYCETVRTVQRLVTEMSCKQVTQTVYKFQCSTETKDVTQTWLCPTTVYRAETEMVGAWNIFERPDYVTRWVPETQWVQRSAVVKAPVTTRKVVPETQVVSVPTTSQRWVSEEVVVSRVPVANNAANTPAIGPTTSNSFSPSAVPTNRVPPPNVPIPTPVQSSGYHPTSTQIPLYTPPVGPIGGISRLTQDPPRYGAGVSGR